MEFSKISNLNIILINIIRSILLNWINYTNLHEYFFVLLTCTLTCTDT